MARTTDPNSARSQFFIVFKDSNFLDGQYTLWGKVVVGHGLRRQDQEGRGGLGRRRSTPDKMIRVRVAADVKE